jgi:hypothetical protein
MTLDDIHHFLTTGFELVRDEVERGNARSYFWKKVDWHPASTTRVLRVHHDQHDTVTRIQLCVSSDNNNSVFLLPPFAEDCLRVAVTKEIKLLREVTNAVATPSPYPA